MPSAADSRQKPRAPALGWSLVVAVGAGAFVLGAWLFHGRSTPARPADSVAAAPLNHGSSSAAEAKPAAAENAASASAADQLLTELRAKLSTSAADVLQALGDIAKTHPALAIDLAHELGRTDEEKAEWVKISMQQWSDRDPPSAWQWIREQSFQRQDELAGGELPALVLNTMAARDPRLVLTNLDSLLRFGNTSDAVSTPVAVHLGVEALVANGRIDLARQAVETWATDPAGLNIEAAAFETVAMALAPTAPLETGAWLRAMPASEERNGAIATFVATWAEHDPRAALQWAEALPPADGQEAAIGRTVSDWIESYPAEVSGWLGDYLSRAPAGPSTDVLIETVINVSPTARADPQVALQWADLISDPAKRAAYEETVALRWGGRDRAAAIDYVWNSPTIPTERKSALVGQIQKAAPTEL